MKKNVFSFLLPVLVMIAVSNILAQEFPTPEFAPNNHLSVKKAIVAVNQDTIGTIQTEKDLFEYAQKENFNFAKIDDRIVIGYKLSTFNFGESEVNQEISYLSTIVNLFGKDIIDSNITSLSLDNLTEQSKNGLRSAFISHYGSDSPQSLSVLDNLLKSKDSTVRVSFLPYMMVFDEKKYPIAFFRPGIERFRKYDPPTSDNNIGIPSWASEPILIVNNSNLKEDDASKEIFLDSNKTYTIEELASKINTSIKVDEKLKKIKLHILGNNWNCGNLVRDVSIAINGELRPVDKIYFWGINSEVREISRIMNLSKLYSDPSKEIYNKIKFMKNDLIFKKSIHPFTDEQYKTDNLIASSKLNDTQKDFIRNKVIGNNTLMYYLRPFFKIRLEIHNKDNEGVSLYTDSTAFPAEVSPEIPTGSSWRNLHFKNADTLIYYKEER